MRIITKNEEETKALAVKIALGAQGGDVFALVGDLGSGKTTFAKGFAKALGIDIPITSPTFVISKTYPLPATSRIKRLVHIDAYRLKGKEDFLSIGGIDIISDPESVSLIEWPEIILPLLTAPKQINFKYLSDNEREIDYDF